MSIIDSSMPPEEKPRGEKRSKIRSFYHSEPSRLTALSITTDSILALIFSTGTIVATYYRLYFGVNFADEAYYIAIPFRFVLGDIPFRDEAASLFSMFSFISYPFFKAFYALQGSTEGIVLYARHLYFVFSLIVAFGVYKVIRNFLSFAEALILASCILAFIPFNISGLCYNSLAAGLLTLGLFTGALGATKESKSYSAVAGFSLALCAVAYLPMLINVFVALLCIALVRKRSIIPTFVGGIVALLLLLPLLKHAELGILRDNFDFYTSVGAQGGNWKKLITVFKGSFTHIWLGTVVCGIICTVLVRTRSPKAHIAAVFIPLVLALTNRFPKGPGAVISHGFVLALALIGPWLYQGLDEKERKFFLSVWIPSAVAALVMGYSSSNGYLNSGIGFLPGGLVSLTMLVALLGKESPGKSSGGRLLQLSLLASTAGILVYYQYAAVYWEAGIGKLNAPIASGPYRYLRTTPEKARFIEQVGTDIKKFAQDADSIVFYYDFPAGYLFSNLKPATNSVWQFSPHSFPGLNTTQLEHRYMTPEKRPDVIFRFEYLLWGDDIHMAMVHMPEHPIDRLLSSGSYRIGVARSEYVVYYKKQQALGL